MRVYLVGMEPLNDGAEASPDPEAAFSTREAAESWGRAHGEGKVGRRYWWGTVEKVDSTFAIWEFEIDSPEWDEVS